MNVLFRTQSPSQVENYVACNSTSTCGEYYSLQFIFGADDQGKGFSEVKNPANKILGKVPI